MTDLTEQWKKGELPEGLYYVENNEGNIGILGWSKFSGWYNVKQVLAPVPTFEEWQALNNGYDSAVDANLKQATWMVAMEKENKRLKHDVGNLGYKIKNQRHEIDNRLKEIEKLKELLKECELWFTGIVGNMNDKNVGEHNRSLPIGNFEYIFKVFSQKINEVLR